MGISKLIMGSVVWLAMLLAAAMLPREFSFQGVSNRFITPNGDNKNDAAVFTVANPQNLEVKGKIFDIRGKLVANMTVDPLLQKLSWDAKAGNGQIVRTGVYVYVIEAEGAAFRGLVVVIR